MKAQTVTGNLIQLTRFGFVNAFLVREEDGFTLVDTTVPRGASAILAAARAAGGPITRIALTHGHGDHVGSLDELRRELGAAVPVAIGELEARILAGEKVIDAKLKGSWPKVSTTPDIRLRPGDHVGSLEVHDAPGHTPGHVAFLDTRDRTLIAGDVYATLGRVAVTDHPDWPFFLPGFVTQDRVQDNASARALRELEPRTLVVGHGKPIRDAVVAMDAALARSPRG